MKKVFCILTIIAVLLPVLGISENIDYSAFSKDELIDVAIRAKLEMTIKDAREEKDIFFFIDEPNGIELYCEKIEFSYSTLYHSNCLVLHFVIINNGTEESVQYSCKDALGNGWVLKDSYTVFDRLKPATAMRAEYKINLSEANIPTPEEIIAVDFNFYEGFYNKMIKSIRIVFDGESFVLTEIEQNSNNRKEDAP